MTLERRKRCEWPGLFFLTGLAKLASLDGLLYMYNFFFSRGGNPSTATCRLDWAIVFVGGRPLKLTFLTPRGQFVTMGIVDRAEWK